MSGLAALLPAARSPRLILLVLAVVAALALAHRADQALRQLRADAFAAGAASRDQEIAALRTTIDQVRETTRRLELEDARRALDAERRSRQLAEESSRDYQARLSETDRRYRAALERLRAGGAPAPADPGRAGGASVPRAAPAAGGPDGAACADGVLVPLDWLLDAERQAAQLDALIAWAEAALRSDNSGAGTVKAPERGLTD